MNRRSVLKGLGAAVVALTLQLKSPEVATEANPWSPMVGPQWGHSDAWLLEQYYNRLFTSWDPPSPVFNEMFFTAQNGLKGKPITLTS